MKRFVLVMVAAVGSVMCASSPTVSPPKERWSTLTTARTPLKICISPGQENRSLDARLHDSVINQLGLAGYQLVSNDGTPCDLTILFSFDARSGSFRFATLTIRTGTSSSTIDNIQLSFNEGEVPIVHVDQLAIILVNTLNASDKVAEWARQPPRRRARAGRPSVADLRGHVVADFDSYAWLRDLAVPCPTEGGDAGDCSAADALAVFANGKHRSFVLRLTHALSSPAFPEETSCMKGLADAATALQRALQDGRSETTTAAREALRVQIVSCDKTLEGVIDRNGLR